MNTEITNLNPLISKITEILNTSTEVATSYLPEIFQQYILFEIVSSSIWMTVGLVGFIIGIFLFPHAKDVLEDDYSTPINFVIKGIFSVALIPIGFIMFTFNTSTLIKALIAPYVLIIDNFIK